MWTGGGESTWLEGTRVGTAKFPAVPGVFGKGPRAAAPNRSDTPAGQFIPAPHRAGRSSFIPRRLCAHWARSGWCRNGDACTFAHGMHELHPEAQMAIMQAQGQGMSPSLYSGDALATTVSRTSFGSTAIGVKIGEGGPKEGFKFNANAPPFAAPVAAKPVAVSTEDMQFVNSESDNTGDELPIERVAIPAVVLPSTMVPTPALAVGNTQRPILVQGTAQTGVAASETVPNCSVSYPVLVECGSGKEPHSTCQASTTTAEASIGHQGASEANGTTGAKLARRKVPSPLTTIEPNERPLQTAQAAPQSPTLVQATFPNASPAAAAARRFLMRIGVPGCSSPTHSATHVVGVYTSSQLVSPKALPSPVMQLSPENLASSSTLQPITPAPLQPTPLPSPTSVVLGSPKPISRGVLLQAGGIARQIYQGPPGLAQYAPTPTSKARYFGFRYPQPGFFRTDAYPAHALATTRVEENHPHVATVALKHN